MSEAARSQGGESPAPARTLESVVSVLGLDRKVVQALFASLRITIPQDVQRRLLCNSAEELQFLIARQPRLSAFFHRRRESLRHPALAMSTKKYYNACRRRRLEQAMQEMAALEEAAAMQSSSGTSGPQARISTTAAQREAQLVDLLLSEYAQQSTGGYAEDYSRHAGNHFNGGATMLSGGGGAGLSVSHGSSVSFSMYGASVSRLLNRHGHDAEADSSTPVLSSPRQLAAVEPGGFAASVKSGILLRRSLSMRNAGGGVSNDDSFSASSDALNNAAGTSRLNWTVGAGESTDGGRGRGLAMSTTSAGATAVRFFAQRHGSPHESPPRRVVSPGAGSSGSSGAVAGGAGGAPGAGGGSAADRTSAGWNAEMRAQLLRRADAEQVACSGNDPYLFISSRPIEHLLCCYGGVARDPVAIALGAASMMVDGESTGTVDADPLYNAMVEDDVRWDQLAGCQRQLLRSACGPCRAAASAVANDRLVNDIIRRYWDRLTVSAAAQHAHRVQEARKSRAAADADIAAAASARGGRRGGEADEDDRNEITEEEKTEEDGQGGGGGGGGGGAGGKGGSPATGGGAARVQKVGRGGAGKKKAKPAGAKSGGGGGASGGGGGSEQLSPIAYYMTPLQYVYLHTRIAHVLLPDCDAAEVELLPYIQEDLLVDAAYDERDPLQTLYFGEAPRLVGDAGRAQHQQQQQQRSGRSSMDAFRVSRHVSQDSTRRSRDDGGEDGDGTGQRSSASLRRRFLTLRRNGYALSGSTGADGDDRDAALMMLGLDDDVASFGARSSIMVLTGGRRESNGTVGDMPHKNSALPSLSLVPMSFTVAQLPSLTYPQFWCSMMELADNWTCCAGNPLETAVFLWELYAEVFGHNWSEDDKALAAATEKKAAARQALTAAERAELEREEAATMEAFNALLAQMPGQWSQSSSQHGSFDSLTGLDTTTREALRRGSRRHNRDKQGEDDADGGGDAFAHSDSDSELSLSQVARLAAAAESGGGEWVYTERIDADGVKHRVRRRVRSGDRQRGSNGSAHVLEEELDEHGKVVKRRRRRWRGAAVGGSDDDESDTSLYTDEGDAPVFRRRKPHADQPKKLRRLERQRRVSPGIALGGGSSNSSSMTSWSSIDDAGVEERRSGKRRRRHGRRVGARRDHQRMSLEEDPERRRKLKWRFPYEKDDRDGQGTADEKEGATTQLTQQELDHLRERKEWLCNVLGAKGIKLPARMFDDPNEQRLLLDLLRLAEESALTGGVLGSGEGGYDPDDEGGGMGDLTGLAALLAQSQAFSLDDLEHSALMRRLLGEGDEDAMVGMHLSPQQLQNILVALIHGERGGGARGGSGRADRNALRDRRLRLLRMFEAQKARQQERKRLEEAAATVPAQGGDPLDAETFALTGVPVPVPPRKPTPPPAPTRKGAPWADAPRPGASPLPTSPLSQEADAARSGLSWTALPLPARSDQSASWLTTSQGLRRGEEGSAPWRLTPSTLAERKEADRLFREFEAYWANRASRGGRYRVDTLDYTPAQLEEFFAHLHLGSRQRALLRGRAPLAAATSLVGGTMHQEGSACGSSPAASPVTAPTRGRPPQALNPSPPPLAPAPVKLFTLTTEGSLDGALRRSYQNYLDDKLYAEALYGTTRIDTTTRTPARPSTVTQPPLPPAASSSARLPGLAKAARGRGASRRSPAASAAAAAPSSAPSAVPSRPTRPSPPASSLPKL